MGKRIGIDLGVWRQCGRCKSWYRLNADYFNRDRSLITGFKTICKECRNRDKREARRPILERKRAIQREEERIIENQRVAGQILSWRPVTMIPAESLAKISPQKTCVACGKTKPETSDFYRNTATTHAIRPGQLRGRCRECEIDSRRKQKISYNISRHADPKYRLADNMRRRMKDSLSGKYFSGKFEVLGYTADELKNRIESTWQLGMSWDNYGVQRNGGPKRWHIDHIRPIASFTFTSAHDIEFIECFSLANLQALWADDNAVKSDLFDWKDDARK